MPLPDRAYQYASNEPSFNTIAKLFPDLCQKYQKLAFWVHYVICSKVKSLVNFRNKEFKKCIVRVNKWTKSLFVFHLLYRTYISIIHMHCWTSFTPLLIVPSVVAPLAPLAPLKYYLYMQTLKTILRGANSLH